MATEGNLARADQVEGNPPERKEQGNSPGDSTKIRLGMDAVFLAISGFFSAMLGGYASEQYVRGADEFMHFAGNSMPVFLSVTLNVSLGLFWVFSIEELIRNHRGSNHQTWNESAKDDLKQLIDEFRTKIKSIETIQQDTKTLNDLLDEAESTLNNDDIYFVKQNQNYNFIRFVIAGAAFATSLGLLASPYAAIAVVLHPLNTFAML